MSRDKTLSHERIIEVAKEEFLTNEVELFKELIVKYRDELKLLICCSKETKYENFINDLVIEEQNGREKAVSWKIA